MSAYYTFKSPTSLDKRQDFSGRTLMRFQGQVNYTPKPRPRINLAAFQRRINVDRVSIRKGEFKATTSLQDPQRRPPFTNADSYSRCPVPDSDCFDVLMRDSAWDVPVGLLLTGCMVTAPARGCGLNGSGQRAIAEARLPGGESGQHFKAVTPWRYATYLSQGMVSVLRMPYQCCHRGLSDDMAHKKNSSQDEIRTSGLQAYGLAPSSIEVPTDLCGLGVLLLRTSPSSIRGEDK